MDKYTIDSIERFKIFARALARVEQNVLRLKQIEEVANREVFELGRDGVIHSFQVCFQQFWKVVMKYLLENRKALLADKDRRWPYYDARCTLSLAKSADWEIESVKYEWGPLTDIEKWIQEAFVNNKEDGILQDILTQYLPRLKQFKEEFQKIVE